MRWMNLLWAIPLAIFFSPIFGIALHAIYGYTWGYVTILFGILLMACGGEDGYD